MKATNSSTAPSYRFRALVTLINRYRVCSSNDLSHGYGYASNHCGFSFSKFGYGNGSDGSSIHRGLSMFSVNKHDPNIGLTSKQIVKPSVPTATPRPRSSYFVWVKWLFGSILPVLLAFWQQKWSNLQKLEGKIEKIGEEVENMAEVVEKVATTTEKVSEEVAEMLNEGKLKDAALMVEHISTVTAKDAQQIEEFVDKVGDLKKDLKDLETIAEPLVDKIIRADHTRNNEDVSTANLTSQTSKLSSVEVS